MKIEFLGSSSQTVKGCLSVMVCMGFLLLMFVVVVVVLGFKNCTTLKQINLEKVYIT